MAEAVSAHPETGGEEEIVDGVPGVHPGQTEAHSELGLLPGEVEHSL